MRVVLFAAFLYPSFFFIGQRFLLPFLRQDINSGGSLYRLYPFPQAIRRRIFTAAGNLPA
jgi:hypothetical protein